MKLSQFKQHLDNISAVNFVQINGKLVPQHFHVTEAGLMTKQFVDCGGTVRTDKTVCIQIWVAKDLDHRLDPQKLKKIVGTYEKLFGNDDLEVEIEYQTETVGRYGLSFGEENFFLTAKQTDCLAMDSCGTPQKEKLQLVDLGTSPASCCSPGGGCC